MSIRKWFQQLNEFTTLSLKNDNLNEQLLILRKVSNIMKTITDENYYLLTWIEQRKSPV